MLRIAVARTPVGPESGRDLPPGWMGEGERRRWTSLGAVARREFVASRGLLRALLHEATGMPVDAWDVSARPGTAPVARSLRGDVVGGPPRASLSHRLGWVAAAVADAAVGIDVECDRLSRSDPGERAALMLAAAELRDWHALADGRREAALLARWAAKEAWFKASPPGDAPWDFRRVIARACTPAQANVRVWESAPLHVAVCCADAAALAAVDCAGLDAGAATSSFWHVTAADPEA